jgi:N-acyl-L-homoserine lactone synthetase
LEADVAGSQLVQSSFGGRVAALLDRVECRRAEAGSDREAVFRLRYRAYLREGAITPRPDEMFSDPLDECPNSYILGIHLDGRLASSIRLTVASGPEDELPAMHVFADILRRHLETGATVIDPTRFVVDHELSRQYPELPYLTVRLAFAASEHFEADLLLATVRQEHQAFYRRVFGHELLCDCRDYPSLTKPISLMSLHYKSQRDRVLRRYPFFESTPSERRRLFGDRDSAVRHAA